MTLVAWITYLAGVSLLGAIDYYLRMVDSNISSGGLPEWLFLSAPLAIGVVSIAVLLLDPRYHLDRLSSNLMVFGQIALAFAIYLVAGWIYIVELGIDSV